MATLAWIYEKTSAHASSREGSSDRYRLRPMPNEDIHVFVKKIDNTRVVRARDPQTNSTALRTVGVTLLIVFFMVGALVPVAKSYLAGYRVTALETQNEKLRAELTHLTVRESELTSVEALARASKNQRYLDATPESLVVLSEPDAAEVAMNRK